MDKRAVISVRTSTEKQGEKVSPEMQERDCREYAERQGYTVVGVYRDTEKYRVGKKLVEPSGTRADRPGLKAMLADARAGKFDVIIAWREDRLYRSYRPMLDVLDCLEETGVTIELVKEHFDANLAPVKAWAARMELQAKQDRTIMGVAGRLEQGKALNNQTPYGYDVDENGRYVINPTEAAVIRSIWQWWGEGVITTEIRRRLIQEGVQQRQEGNKYTWHKFYIYRFLKRDYYVTGIFPVKWGGKSYELSVPPIIDAATAEAVKQRRTAYKAYPAGNLKAPALFAGKVFCQACGVRMKAKVVRVNGRAYFNYRCGNAEQSVGLPGCARSLKMAQLDTEGWDKVWSLISEPGELEAKIQARVAELQTQEFDARAECEKLESHLADLAIERQKVCTWGRKGIITEADMAGQLAALGAEESEARRELADKSLLVGNRAERLLAVARTYRERVAAGLDAVQSPQTPEEAELVWDFKRKIVEGIVERVDVAPDKSITVTVDLDLGQDEALHVSNPPTWPLVNDTQKSAWRMYIKL